MERGQDRVVFAAQFHEPVRRRLRVVRLPHKAAVIRHNRIRGENQRVCLHGIIFLARQPLHINLSCLAGVNMLINVSGLACIWKPEQTHQLSASGRRGRQNKLLLFHNEKDSNIDERGVFFE